MHATYICPIKIRDSELRGQEEAVTTEWVIYKEQCRKCSNQVAVTASAQLLQPQYVLTT